MSRELVVLSHLRWTFVWQRPQQLVSRLSPGYDRVWFVEEPCPVDGLAEPVLRTEEHEHVVRVWMDVPAATGWRGFEPDASRRYTAELAALVRPGSDVWLYTPMALDLARSLHPAVLVYDVMDDLAAFRFAPPAMVLAQRQALREAHVVFTGGRSLHRGVLEHREQAVHCFPSGVDPAHYAPAVAHRRARPAGGAPVAGYVGVIDERVDLGLLAGLAGALPDWEIRIVGPVAKIDAAQLPQAPNLRYPGPAPYAALPEVMGGFDVALMPFALNEATRSISPTKTLEYLAAGLAVVSTRVPDVVADHAGVVALADDAAGFAEACRRARIDDHGGQRDRVRVLLHDQHWDTIALRMAALLDAARTRATAPRPGRPAPPRQASA